MNTNVTNKSWEISTKLNRKLRLTYKNDNQIESFSIKIFIEKKASGTKLSLTSLEINHLTADDNYWKEETWETNISNGRRRIHVKTTKNCQDVKFSQMKIGVENVWKVKEVVLLKQEIYEIAKLWEKTRKTYTVTKSEIAEILSKSLPNISI